MKLTATSFPFYTCNKGILYFKNVSLHLENFSSCSRNFSITFKRRRTNQKLQKVSEINSKVFSDLYVRQNNFLYFKNISLHLENLFRNFSVTFKRKRIDEKQTNKQKNSLTIMSFTKFRSSKMVPNLQKRFCKHRKLFSYSGNFSITFR